MGMNMTVATAKEISRLFTRMMATNKAYHALREQYPALSQGIHVLTLPQDVKQHLEDAGFQALWQVIDYVSDYPDGMSNAEFQAIVDALKVVGLDTML